MNTKFFLLITTVFFATHLFAQVKAVRPLAKKTVVTTAATRPLINPKPAKTENPPPKPTDLQNASVSIISGDDGKDNDTYLFVDLLDNNKRVAATYNNVPNSTFPSRPNDEFYAGASVSLPMTTEASIPTTQMKQAGGILIPIMRQATLADFNNQGEVKIRIQPNGHDTWKLQTLSITFSFDNDNNSPHKITWSNIVLSQNNTTIDLLFDKNFNPIQ
jgi:hypothetical protein